MWQKFLEYWANTPTRDIVLSGTEIITSANALIMIPLFAYQVLVLRRQHKHLERIKDLEPAEYAKVPHSNATIKPHIFWFILFGVNGICYGLQFICGKKAAVSPEYYAIFYFLFCLFQVHSMLMVRRNNYTLMVDRQKLSDLLRVTNLMKKKNGSPAD
jgi:hypothetical protein